MRVLPRTLTEPEIEPVTLSQLRAHVHADADVDDMILRGFLITARTMVEQWMGRAIVPRSVVAVFEQWPEGRYGNGDDAIELLMPVSSIDSITYTNASGATVPWTDFIARLSQGGVMRVRERAGYSWPNLGNDPIITLTATAGFDEMPEPVVSAVMMLAGYLYADRDGQGDSSMGVGKIPRPVKDLIAPWRWRWLG
jgi:uncharacterized phiE125 gp8 family phage protein